MVRNPYFYVVPLSGPELCSVQIPLSGPKFLFLSGPLSGPEPNSVWIHLSGLGSLSLFSFVEWKSVLFEFS